jgi:hypothetical protein
MTKIDRAVTVQCFYMEADKTVSTGIEVSEITTGFQTQVVPMPVCRYEILDSPTGQPVRFAIIGQGVFHKWTCDTDTGASAHAHLVSTKVCSEHVLHDRALVLCHRRQR